MTTAAILGIVFGFLALLVIVLLCLSIKIVPETYFWIVQRLGKYHRTLEKGVNFIFPIIDRVVVKENIKEKVFDFPVQSVITKDNATIKVDTVVYLKIFDAKLYSYGAENPFKAIENLVATTLRNLIGELELDQSLTSREIINAKLTKTLDEASDAWGIRVNRVEIQNIIPPKEVEQAMIRQMQAERDKRARILESEGIKQSLILNAQGNRESVILNAEAAKEKIILQAEAEKQRILLEAQAKKQSIELLNEAKISKEVLQYKALDEIKTLANGTATKIIIPPNLSEIAKIMAVGKEVFQDNEKSKK
ncbi:SPFH domain-containing protein [Mycoplasma sp. 128]